MGANNTHVYYGIRSQNFGSNISFEYGNGVFDGASGHFTSASFGACSSPTIGSWHFYVVTYSGTTLTTYCDGNLVGMATATLDPTFGGLAFTQGSSGWVGSMDAPRVYDRALSLSEVQTLYESSY